MFHQWLPINCPYFNERECTTLVGILPNSEEAVVQKPTDKVLDKVQNQIVDEEVSRNPLEFKWLLS